jgi:hypothetical protein
MIQRDDWLPMIVETDDQRQQRQELFLVYAGPLIALLCFGVVLSYAIRALG